MPSQHEDVLFAENRLTKPDGFGVLFTNGTGTGKTFLGLGIIKRMHKSGKRNGLIVVPNDAVMNEWMRSAKDIGLTITALESTSDKGRGIAITTYANLANNLTLADRDIDFFVADEAHSLMSNAQAEVTGGLKTARAITLHPDSAIDRTNLIERDAVARLATLKSEIEVLGRLANRDDTMDEMRRDYQKQIADMEKESGDLQKKWDRTLDAQKELIASRQNETRPRSIFLSATPFAYEKNTDWANAYLYSYGRDNPNRGYNEPGPRESFMVRHFGYTMRHNKLTEPDASVDRGLMQRQFNTWMRKQGVLSARMLNVEQDYDRKFVLIDGGIGTRIDQALKWLREADGGKYYPFYSAANERFDYLSRSRLLEAIKAKAAIPYIKAQHALGRKVVVFYDYNQGGGFNAFDFGLNRDADIEVNVIDPDTKAFNTITYKKGEFIDAFNREFPDLIGAAFERATSPLDTLTEAFPTAGVYNGIVQKSTRQSTIDNFNNDDMPEANLLIVQSSANAGWSGHDRTGKFPRVLINLGLPVAPTKAIQQEGRIYRVGQASNAIFRYFNTGTLWEKYAFATKVARRASTAENLAMGEDARGLLDSFLDAFENSAEYPPSQNEGTGGKAIDRDTKALLSDFDRAKTFYYARLKKNSGNKSQEGVDFFPTPEPIGLKMVEWLHARPNDDLLEPSAGDGAIARWFPESANRTVVEPSFELGSRLALVTDAKMVTEPFEQLNIINKYDGIAMNPPFGVGGKTAMEHVAKAFGHLKERGRLIALIPEGPMMDRRLEEWLNQKDARDRAVRPEARLIASISLPTTVFGRAGTAVKTRIIIIDKVSDKNIVSTAVNYDLSKSDDINETFDLVNALDFARVQSAVAQAPAQSTPAAPAGRVVDNLDDATFEVKDGKLVTDAPEVTYKTQAGKILKGVYVPFPTVAKEVDPYTFRAKGMPGHFVRLQHVVRPTLDVSVEPDSTGGNYLSLTRPEATARTDTPEFKLFFGNSKVVDEQGNPLVVYHGTTRADFTVFNRLKSLEWRGPSMDTVGSWFSNNPSEDGGAGMYSAGGNSALYPVYLSIQNPKVYRTFNDFLRDMHRAAGRPFPENAPGRGSTEELRDELKAQGYDGIEFEQTANESLMQDIMDMQDAVKRAKEEEFSVPRRDRQPYTQKRERLEQTLKSMRKELDEFGSSTEFDKQRVFIAFEPEQIKSVFNRGTFDPANPDILFSLTRTTAADKKNSVSEARISPRRPTAVKATEDPLAPERLQPDLASAKLLGKGFTRNINLMAAYPNFVGIKGTAEQKAEQMIEQMVDNLVWLHNHWRDEYRGRTKLWYLGGNRIAARWSDRFGASIQKVVSAIAMTSPQKDWFQNVSIAERILEALTNNADVPFDAKMRAAAMSRAWGKGKAKILRKIEGKTLRDLYDENDDASLIDMAVWIRAWDEANNPQMARVITPEGAFKNDWDRGKTGKPVGFRWQSFPTIARTIKALATDDRAAISEIIGSNHKVRSFFNNLVAPLFGEDVTIDTHAVAAALLRPLGSASIEVKHNFGSGNAPRRDADGNVITKGIPGTTNSSVLGLYGTYAIYAEAYRRAAQRVGILPREMQSITWEAVRGLFRPEQKNEKIKRQVDAIWKRVAKGELNVSEARERISGLVEGIRDPAWAGSDAGMDEAGRDSSYQSRVSQGSGSGGATVGRAGDGVARAVQEPAGLASPAVAFSQLPESVRADALTKLKGLERKLEQGKITEAEYRLGVQQVIGALERRNEVQQARREETDLRRGADWIVSQLRRGLADEKIPRKAVDFAQWLLQQNPQLADGLAISVVAPKSKDSQVAGDYNPALQVMRLIIGQSDDDTAVHEILHHTERMMPAEVRQGITKAWQRAWDAAYRAGDTDTRIALTNMLKASMGNPEARQRTLQAFRDGLLNMDAHYQLYSASEFWAVNGTRILSGRFEADKSWVKRAIQWFKEFIERVKDVFGLPSDAAVLKGLNAVMAGDGQFVTNKMLSQASSYNAITPQGPIGQSPTPPPVPTAAQNAMVMTGGQNQPVWNVTPAGLMDKFIYEVQDRQINLKRVQEAISTVSNIREQFDAYTKEELYHGRVAARTDKFLSKELQPLLEDMKARKVSLDQIESYLWARHAKERNAQVAKINPAFPDGGSGLTNAQVDDYFNGIDVVDANGDVIIEGIDSAQARHLDALARRVDAINAGTKQILIQYGLESPDTITAWDSTYKHYVPLFREDMEGSMPIGQGFSVKGSASRRALGSKRAVVDIIANLALQRETALTRGEKNRVGMSLYALAKSNPNADIWEVGKVPMKRVIDPRTGLVTAVPDPGYKNQDNVLVVRMRGKDVAVIFNQRNERAMQMALTLKNLDIAAFGAVMGAVSTGTRYFASINTQYNPIFGVLNIIRDSFAAPLNLTTTALANKKFAVMRQVPFAIRAIWKIERNGSSGTPYDALYEQMKMSGGTTGYREMFRVGKDRADKLQKEINALNASAPRKAFNWLLDWLDDYNTALENAVRLSAFRVGLASGISPDKSASISKNITVNFNRKGRVGRELGAWYAFFNAAVQGTTRTIQTLRGPAGGKIIMGGVALGVMQTLVAMMAFDDDEWEDIPDFIKQRNFIIPVGGAAYITVPYPLGFNVLPNIGRIASEWIRQGGKNPGKHAVDLLMSVLEASNPFGSGTLSQMISPTLADPIVALAENKDFTGRPIAKTDLVSTDPTPGFMRARDTSSTVSRFLSERLNAMTGGTKYTPGLFTPTPDQIDYVFGTLTGGIGRELNRGYQSIEMTLQGKDVPEHRKPLWGRFYGTTDEDSAVSSRYWRNVRELNTLEREYNGRLKDREEVNSLIKSNPEVTWAKSLNANERQIGRMRAERTRIEFDQKLAESDRTTKLDAQDKLIVDAMRRYNDQVRLAKGKKPLPPPDDSSD